MMMNKRRRWNGITMTTVFILVIIYYYYYYRNFLSGGSSITGKEGLRFLRDEGAKMPLPEWIVHNAGPIAPFHRTRSYVLPPPHCQVVQVHQLQRHGARFPTKKVTMKIISSLNKLINSSYLHSSLKFIKHYKYRLGESKLIPLGVYESIQAGHEFGTRYQHLILSNHSTWTLPFIRASLSQRVVDSAHNFSLGLLSSIGHSNLTAILPVLISELPKANNTLDNNWCPNRRSSSEKRRWLEKFAKSITLRLNNLAKDAYLNDYDSLILMQLCVFESLAFGELSPFCPLFHPVDWLGFGYYFDLDKYYGHGVGNNVGGIEGLGYLSELVSRLTGDRKWVNQDQSKVNHRLDESETTFPINRTCYIDFSHDNQMVSILATLGIQTKEELSETGPIPKSKNWDVSQWMPFGSRLTVEKLKCSHHHHHQSHFVRFLLNDMLMKIPTLDHQIISSNKNLNYSHDTNMYNMYSMDHFIQYHQPSLENSEKLFHQVEFFFFCNYLYCRKIWLSCCQLGYFW